MEKLLTYCPRCRSKFYSDVDEKDEDGYIQIVCPHCNFEYGDRYDKKRVKEMKYNWELYDNIKLRLEKSESTNIHLNYAGFSFIFILGLFAIGVFSLVHYTSFTVLHKSIWMAGLIFSFFVVLGTYNSLKRRSFILSFTGGIFAILGIFVWSFLLSEVRFLLNQNIFSFFYTLLGLFLSVFSLILILKNRTDFDYGY